MAYVKKFADKVSHTGFKRESLQVRKFEIFSHIITSMHLRRYPETEMINCSPLGS